MAKSSIKDVGRLGTPPYATLDPFLFAVYHKDVYPPGDGKMQVPGGARGNGADFDHSKPWRFYHGDRVPGFPQHPHRGFETITATMEGLVDHTDSHGNAGRYGNGDLQWMTAGAGVVHGEMFPLLETTKNNTCRFFQLWLNLPARNKFADPAFVMHWAETVTKTGHGAAGGASTTVFAGTFGPVRAQASPPKSWAADPANDVGVWVLSLPPGSSVRLDAAAGGAAVNRRLYFHEGAALSVDDQDFSHRVYATLDAGRPTLVRNPHPSAPAEVLVLQGRPIGEPVAQRGPFVMNTFKEIQQAYADFAETRFGGWPWPDDAVVFPADKGRFALLDGKETRPPK